MIYDEGKTEGKMKRQDSEKVRWTGRRGGDHSHYTESPREDSARRGGGFGLVVVVKGRFSSNCLETSSVWRTVIRRRQRKVDGIGYGGAGKKG